MNPLDDRIPEELQPQNQDLITFLRRSYHSNDALTADEQARSLSTVRERLLHTLPSPKPAKPRRHPRFMHTLNVIAAVLVVCFIIGAALFLFARRPQSTTVSGPPLGPVGTPVTVQTEANGVSATMSITSGPYFLSELVAADISIVNNTNKTLTLEGSPGSPCGSALNIDLSGGTAPHYAVPVYGFMSCPVFFTKFKPEQTIHVRQYFPLTASGHIVLTLGATFLHTIMQNGQQVTTNGPDPLNGHWPAFHITVHPQIPSDRTILLQLDGSRVIVHASPYASSHLLYDYTVGCTGTGSGNFQFQPTKSTTINEPGCPGPNVQWQYAVSAPGYAIASGQYPPSTK
jgi:hypothetical protein